MRRRRSTGRPGRPASKAAFAATLGAAAVAAYAAGAWLSGSLSPIARRPLLDTSIITLPYRWVNPPAALAAKNQKPDSGDFTISFQHGRSDAGVFATNDQQVSVVFSIAAIPQPSGATSVHMTVDPLDPATIGALPGGQHVLGNAYRIEATGRPGDVAVTSFDKKPLLIMVYPGLVTHGGTRSVQFSPDGRSWTALGSTDDPANLQMSTDLTRLNGYYEVATSGTIVSTPGSGGSSGSSPVAWIVIAVAVVVAGALVAIRLRARSREQATTGPKAASTRPVAGTTARKTSSARPGSSSQRRRRGPPPKRKRR
ncbi:MAG TPA: hypothetical protein VID47_04225 [Actinomycetota bacterium]|jgi:hypothetical protein